MARTLVHAQTAGLLIRSYHWYRRQTCSLVCYLAIAPGLLILLTVLNQTISRPKEYQATQAEQKPKGAFAPRPFDPSHCVVGPLRQPRQTSVPNVSSNLYCPTFSVPVYANPSIANEIGPGNPSSQTDPKILSSYSLDPFEYVPALNSTFEFFHKQTSYDAVLLYANFDGERNNTLFQAINRTALAGTADVLFDTTFSVIPSRDGFLDEIYRAWIELGPFPKLYSAIAFDSLTTTSESVSLSVTLFYNESSTSNCTLECPLVSNVVRTYAAIYQRLSDGKNAAFAYLRRMPVVNASSTTNFIPLVISIVIALLLHFLFPTMLCFIVAERVNRIRPMMSSMGLGRNRYWVGTYLSLFFIYLATVIVIILVGVIVKIPFFIKNTPISYLVLFFLWGHILVAMSMFFSPFFADPGTAQILGWAYALIVNLIGGPYIGQRLANDSDESTWYAIMLLPTFALMRPIYFAGAFNSGGEGVTLQPRRTYSDVQLGMCAGSGPFCTSYLFLFAEWIFLLTFALYFDRVLPTAIGTRAHPLFFLGFKRDVSGGDHNDVASHDKGINVNQEDVLAKDLNEKMSEEPFGGVVIHNLSRIFSGKRPVYALSDVSLVVKQNEVLCVLAHNGAGKTTMFRLLVGELEPSSGNAFVNGHSILTNIDSVRQSMGVAPQKDTFWEDLTVSEHLFFYGRMKNLSGAQLKQAVAESLSAVQLEFARRKKVKRLSGGMRRRLSVSLAMIGNPTFILLDEPSTGLDINARQKLWESINRMRQDKVVILTTHSLEEAEALSTRIAIMSQGRLKCIGTADELKFLLGKGHRLSVWVPPSKVDEMHRIVMDFAPGATVETVVGGSIEYVVPRDVPVSTILEMISENKAELQIRDWSISQSSLEDVFMKVTRDSYRVDAGQHGDGDVENPS